MKKISLVTFVLTVIAAQTSFAAAITGATPSTDNGQSSVQSYPDRTSAQQQAMQTNMQNRRAAMRSRMQQQMGSGNGMLSGGIDHPVGQ